MMRDKAKLDRFFDERLTDPALPVMGYSISVFEGAETIYERQGGFARYDAEHPENCVPMSAASRFRIASVSKMFTAAAVHALVDAGKLDLDEEAGHYLGYPLRNPHYPEDKITLRMLMDHTSSLRNGAYYIMTCRRSLKELFDPASPAWENGSRFAAPDGMHDMAPGKFYAYADLNYSLLATIIERISGERFDLYMRDHLMKPLGIGASFNPALFSEEEIKDLCTLYRRRSGSVFAVDQPWTAQDDDFRGKVPPENLVYFNNPYLRDPNTADDLTGYKPGTNAAVFGPAGALRISPRELNVFERMLINGGLAPSGERILSEASAKRMQTPSWICGENGVRTEEGSQRAFALGAFFIAPQFGGDHVLEGREDVWLVGHSGSANGLYSGCFWNPEKECGFAYAYNGVGSDPDILPGKWSSRNLLQESSLAAIAEYLFG